MAMRERNPHLGDTLDSFLEEEGILEETQAIAVKRVIAYQIGDLLKQINWTQADLARAMGTSKAAINRLLNPNNTGLNLNTLVRAAKVLGKNIAFSFE
jgi:antitoxin HicB